MRRVISALLWILLGCPVVAFGQSPDIFTAQEREWIAANPSVRIAVDPSWAPVAYLDGQQVKGLAAEYLAAITRISGLKFLPGSQQQWVNARAALVNGDVDLLPAAYPRMGLTSSPDGIAYSSAYFAGSTLVVTRADATVIFDPQQLAGKAVAVKHGAAYERELKDNYPLIQVIPAATPAEALDMVASGKAYAAIDIDAAVIPMLHHRYFDELHVAGVLAQLPAVLSMAVRSDDQILLGILDKSLASLNAQDTDRMMALWLEAGESVRPSWTLILKHYWLEFAAAGGVLLLLALLSYRVYLARLRAERSEREKAMFLAVMSHEIRTPMHAILASVELLAQGRLPPEEARLVKVAVTSSVTLLELLDDVLDFSKMEAGKLQLDCHPVDIRALLQEAMDIAQARAAEKCLPLRLVLPEAHGPRPLLDAHRVRQVLNNLLSNAIKFTDSGHVEMRAHLERRADDAWQAVLHIRVSDTGIGISERQQARLFKAFSQGDSSTTRRYGGTGLGLTICKDLVKLMGGSIRVESEFGEGTAMLIELPVALAPPQAVTPPSQTAAEHVVRPTQLQLLVIEDHPINQFIIERQLASLGHRVVQAVSGSAGLALFGSHVFDLVFLDCNLPDMDGYAVARRMREQEETTGQHTPIIAISAMVGGDHTRQCLDAGMDGLLSKPLRIQELKEMVDLWCARRQDEPPQPHETHEPTMLQLLRDTSLSDLALIRLAAAQGDWPQVARLAHRIGGAASMMRLHELAQSSQRLEHSARGESAEAPGPNSINDLEVALHKALG